MKSVSKQIVRAYLICAAPRTGSTLLQEALYYTYIAGNPQEYFGLTEEHWLRELRHEPGEAYVEKVLASGTTHNGVFGAKILEYQFCPMVDCLRRHFGDQETPTVEFLARVFPNLRYIWMRRRDKVAQAVSESMAVQTKIWQQVDYNATKIPAMEPVFNFQEINKFRRFQESYDRGWEQFFAESGITPFILDYEDLVANYLESVYKVLAFLDLPTSAPVRRPRLVRQANATSRDWMERYRAMANEMRGGSAATDAGPPAQAFEQAVQFQKQGRTREAEELYLAVLGQEPEHLDALHNLGLLRLEAGNPSEAEVLLARVLAKAPQSPRLLNNYGVALDSLKRHEVAIKYFARALQLSPDYAECHNNIGNALQMLGRHDDALRHYQLALTLKPDYVDAHRNLGRALLNIANVYRARAIAHFEKSLSLKPQDAEAYCGLGIAHQALNQFDNAVTFLAKAIAIDPQHVEARQQLALTTSIAQQSSRPAAQTIGGAGRFTLQLADEPRESGRMPDRTSKLEDAIDVRDGREAHG